MKLLSRLLAAAGAAALASHPAFALPQSVGPQPQAGTTAGTFAAGNDSRITGALQANSAAIVSVLGYRPRSALQDFSSAPNCSGCASTSSSVFSQISSAPVTTQSTTQAIYPPYIFQGDTSHVYPEYFLINGLDDSFNHAYIDSTVTPHTRYFDVSAGSSGFVTTLTAAVNAGATTLPVASNAGIVSGQQYGFDDQVSADPVSDVFTVVSTTSTSITIAAPGLSASHNSGAFISHGKRTMHPLEEDTMTSRGYGDYYVFSSQIAASATPLAGQSDIFKTSTTGWFGGIIYGTQPGLYLQENEFQINDEGNDDGAAANVITFFRSNNTGARGAAWFGNYYNSAGSVPANAGYVLSGRWNVGFDTVNADFSSNGYAAYQMSAGQRVYYDSSNAGGAALYGLYGNTVGTTWTGYVAADNAWEVKVKGVPLLALYSNGAATVGLGEIAGDGTNTYLKSGSPGAIYLQPGGSTVGSVDSAGVHLNGPATFSSQLNTPASSSASCTAGQFEDDANYHYVCVSANTWKRVALSAF